VAEVRRPKSRTMHCLTYIKRSTYVLLIHHHPLWCLSALLCKVQAFACIGQSNALNLRRYYVSAVRSTCTELKLMWRGVAASLGGLPFSDCSKSPVPRAGLKFLVGTLPRSSTAFFSFHTFFPQCHSRIFYYSICGSCGRYFVTILVFRLLLLQHAP
jgi:hypothetical protein